MAPTPISERRLQLCFLSFFGQFGKVEDLVSDLSHLNLFRAFRNPIPSMVAVDVLERLMPAIPDTAMDLFSVSFIHS